MYLSINFNFFSNFFNLCSNPYSKTNFFFSFKLSYLKFARNFTQTQAENPNTQKLKTQP